MDDEDFAVDAVSNRHVAEEVTEEFIGLNVVFVFDFALEAVEAVEVPGFVVASVHEEVLGESNFPGKEGNDDLH